MERAGQVPYSEVDGIEFYTAGEEEIRRLSSVSVVNDDSFRNNLPHPGGIYDAHMGSTDRSWDCATCLNHNKYCPGHTGHIELRYPFQSPLFMKDIIKYLKVICFKCGSLIIKPRKLKLPREKWLSEYAKLAKGKTCYKCKEPHDHPHRNKGDYVSIVLDHFEKNKITGKPELVSTRLMYPHEILPIFDRVHNETVLELGKTPICHPRNLILQVLRVPPNSIRPDVKNIEGSRSSSNDLTVLIQSIVRINESLPLTIPEEPEDQYLLAIQNLGQLIYELIKGSSATTNKKGIVTNAKRQLQSLSKRWVRKHGRIRWNLLGRRVRNMIRSVISCDPNLAIDEVGIPQSQAIKIQVAEVVQEYNITRMNIYYMNGRRQYPGCAEIMRADTRGKHNVERLHKIGYKLQIGDIVYRDLINGDVVDFNRQPSLTSNSVLAHKVVIFPFGDTIRMNVLACPFFNAD